MIVKLTEQQIRILNLLANFNYTESEIAHKLRLNESQLKQKLTVIRQLLGARTNCCAIMRALSHKIITYQEGERRLPKKSYTTELWLS